MAVGFQQVSELAKAKQRQSRLVNSAKQSILNPARFNFPTPKKERLLWLVALFGFFANLMPTFKLLCYASPFYFAPFYNC